MRYILYFIRTFKANKVFLIFFYLLSLLFSCYILLATLPIWGLNKYIFDMHWLFFASFTTLVLSLWWKRKSNYYRKRHRDDPDILNRHYGIFLLLISIGLYGLIFSFNYFSPDLKYIFKYDNEIYRGVNSVNKYVRENDSEQDNYNDIAEIKKDDLPIWAGLFALILTVASAYYLVALQGITTQSKDLLKKLEEYEGELKEIKEQIVKTDNVSDAVFISLGHFIRTLSNFIIVLEHSNVNLSRESFNKQLGVMSMVLKLNNDLYKSRNINNRSFFYEKTSEIVCSIKELENKLSESKESKMYIPLELVNGLVNYLELALANSNLASERSAVRSAIKSIKKIGVDVESLD